MGPIQKIEGGIHGGQNAQTVEGDQFYIENVDTFLQVNIPSASKPKKIWEYMISYVVVFLVGMIAIGIFGMLYIAWSSGNLNHIDQNTLKTAIINDRTSPFVGISFMIAGIGFSILFGIVHWLIKLPNLYRQQSDTN